MSEREREIDDWLRRVLGGVAYRREPASADASFRRYLRVRLDGETHILMDAPPANEDCRPFLAIRDLLGAAGLSVPRVHAADPGRGFVLLEDLGDTLYLEALARGDADALYADALEALVRMQSRAPTGSVPPYDETLVRRELALFPDWLLERHLGIAVKGRLRRALEESFDRLVEAFAEQPAVFVHRDYHSRNLMVLARNNPGVLDFQDAVAGPVTYDLLSLLRDVYVQWPEARVARWIGCYRSRARRAGLPVADATTFRRWFELTGAQRHLKVAGIFARLWHRDGKPGYLRDVPLTLEYLDAELAAGPELAPLRAALAPLDLRARIEAENATLRARSDVRA